MRILIVDNGTTLINELIKLVNTHEIIRITRNEISKNALTNIDLIILSGSSESAVVTHPELYTKELDLIKTCAISIIGICMGFEVIAYAYNSILKELPYKEHGLVDIVATNTNEIFANNKFFKVMENHRWAVVKVGDELQELAISKDGVEALKHKNKKIYGFQFHPEIFNEKNTGLTIFNNLLKSLLNSSRLN